MTRKLLLVADATGSMGDYLRALKESLWEILHLVNLVSDFEIGFFWYRDYCDNPVTGFSGFSKDFNNLHNFIQNLGATGGGDTPEATKTALYKIASLLDQDSITFFYTDAPPHTLSSKGENYNKELKNIPNHDWVHLCKNVPGVVYNFVSHESIIRYHAFLGKCILLSAQKSEISKHTMNVLLGLTGYSNEKIQYYYSRDDNIINELGLVKPNMKTQELENLIPKENLVFKFRNDLTFREKVYSSFGELLTKSHVMILTTNPVFGLLWREICKMKNGSCGGKDGDQKDILVSKLELCLRDLNQGDQIILRKWIAESYNSIEEIKEMINKIPIQFPALINSGGSKLSREDVLLITRECTSQSVRNVIKLLSQLSVTEKDPLGNQDYLPLGLDNFDLFSSLPHLIAPGLKFTTRASIFIALLCYVNENSLLKDRAEIFLKEKIGKWYDPETPENYTYEFMSWWLKAPQFLTPEEEKSFKILTLYSSFRFNLPSQIELKVPYSPHGGLYPDHKKSCGTCHRKISYSLIREDGNCAFCFYGDSFVETDQSNLYSCKICDAIYCVVHPDKLNCHPKCYFCRNKMDAPIQECGKCLNKFVSYIPFSTCGFCETGDGTEIIKDAIDIIWKENPHLNQAIGFKLTSEVTKINSLFAISKVIVPVESSDGGEGFIYNRKPIHNEILPQIKNWLSSGGAERTTCYLCGDRKLRRFIDPACGKCPAEACEECLKNWYGQLIPGKISQLNHLSCPFCKRIPTGKTLHKYNKEILLIHKQMQAADESMYHAWCTQCYKIREYGEKSCSADTPEVEGFVCLDCQNVPIGVDKKCPGCQIPTIRTSGCDHMTCPCGTHWCYECGVMSTLEDIYDHINEDHR